MKKLLLLVVLVFFLKPSFAHNHLNIDELEYGKFSIEVCCLDSPLEHYSLAHKVAKSFCSDYKFVKEEKNEQNYSLTIQCPTLEEQIKLVEERDKKIKEEKKKLEEEKKKKEEEKKIAKELEEQKKKEKLLLASINLKRDICTKIGFENETEGMSNCILQLMLQENEGKTTTTINTSDSGTARALNKQNEILEKQLRLQKLEANQDFMRRSQYMMKYGKIPIW